MAGGAFVVGWLVWLEGLAWIGGRGVKGRMRDFKETKEGKIGRSQHEWRVRLEGAHNRGA
jgi:hypothetical protein